MEKWDGKTERRLMPRTDSLDIKFDIYVAESKLFREGILLDINHLREEVQDVRHSLNGTSAVIGISEKVRGLVKSSEVIEKHEKRITDLETDKARVWTGAAIIAFMVGCLTKIWPWK